MKRSLISLVALISAVVAFSGCGPTMMRQPYNLSIQPQTDASIEVDFIGAKDTELAQLQAFDISKYWQPGSTLRDAYKEGDKKVIDRISSRTANPQVIPISDKIWQNWKAQQVRYLVIIANLPGEHGTGAGDPRRTIVDLSKKFVFSDKKETVEIQILDGRINVVTPQKP